MLYITGKPDAIFIPNVELTDCSLPRIYPHSSQHSFVVLKDRSLHLWGVRPCVQLFSIFLDEASLAEYGTYCDALWKLNSNMLVVTTSLNFVMFYHVECDEQRTSSGLYLTDTVVHSRDSSRYIYPLTLHKAYKHDRLIENLQISCLTNLKMVQDYLLIASTKGDVFRLLWETGKIEPNLSFNIYDIPFADDWNPALELEPIGVRLDRGAAATGDVYVKAMDFSGLLPGLVVLLSDGSIALIVSMQTAYFFPIDLQGVWLPTKTATAFAINHPNRMIAVGRSDSKVDLFAVNETTGTIELTQTLSVPASSCPDVFKRCGGVRTMCYNNSLNVLAVTWQKDGYALWSVFGCLLHMSQVAEPSSSAVHRRVLSFHFTGESYFALQTVSDADASNRSCNMFLLYRLVKSVLSASVGHMNFNSVPLLTDNSLILLSNSNGNILQHIPIYGDYLEDNWPIKYAAVNTSGSMAALAGMNGFIVYVIGTNSWKRLCSESQERELLVRDIFFWRNYVVIDCNHERRNEIRFYPITERFDQKFCTKISMQFCNASITDDDLLLAVDSASWHLSVYSIRAKASNWDVVSKLVCSFPLRGQISHPATISWLTTARFNYADGGASESASMLNVLVCSSGKLLMFQQECLADVNVIRFMSPVVVSANVEFIWLCDSGPLRNAIFLSCGSELKIWLPLNVDSNRLLSKRIMLSLSLSNVYPLNVNIEKCMINGVVSDCDVGNNGQLSFTLSRQMFPFLHRILKQLLRRNLGLYALQLSKKWSTMKHFQYSAELLLHSVLEEEAAARFPIPDPLLPRVIALLQEFSFYFSLVSHCARKSEVSLWPHLFKFAGAPQHLFRHSMENDELETAASFLVILQNMLTPNESHEFACELIRKSLTLKQYIETANILKYLIQIDPSEDDEPQYMVNQQFSTHDMIGTSQASPHHTKKLIWLSALSSNPSTPPLSPATNLGHSGHWDYASIMRGELQSPPATATLAPSARTKSAPPAEKPPLRKKYSNLTTSVDVGNSVQNRSNSGAARKSSSSSMRAVPDSTTISLIIENHAISLYREGFLAQLCLISAHLSNIFCLRAFISRMHSIELADYVSVFKHLHEDFNFPMPHIDSGRKYTTELSHPSQSAACKPIIKRSVSSSVNSSDLVFVPAFQRDAAGTNHFNFIKSELAAVGGGGSDDGVGGGSQFELLSSFSPSVIIDSSAVNIYQNGIIEQTDAFKRIQWISQVWEERILYGEDCYDYTILLSIMTRDFATVKMLLETISNFNTLEKLYLALSDLSSWSKTYCLGYYEFIRSVLKLFPDDFPTSSDHDDEQKPADEEEEVTAGQKSTTDTFKQESFDFDKEFHHSEAVFDANMDFDSSGADGSSTTANCSIS